MSKFEDAGILQGFVVGKLQGVCSDCFPINSALESSAYSAAAATFSIVRLFHFSWTSSQQKIRKFLKLR